MDLGQSRRGVDMGPSALRSAGLQAAIKKLGVTVEDLGQGEADLHADVDAAYRTKYGHHGSESMVTAAAAATTLRLAPDR